jgi:hypothetical protein
MRRRASTAAFLLTKPRLLVNDPSERLIKHRHLVPEVVSYA